MDNIRNFCIIAHIDHGKSTLADRFLEETGAVELRKMRSQYLDQLELERERGITIKMAPVRMHYQLGDKQYILNLIDTPGHSDFAYEVSRALQAVEGAILLIDATQGIQAQTLSNLRAAQAAGLNIVGAINKIDLFKNEKERLDKLAREVANFLGIPKNDLCFVSAKTGEGVKKLLEAVIEKIKPPQIKTEYAAALIFDSFYDNHKGVVASVRLFGGRINQTDEIYLVSKGVRSKIKELGFFSPNLKPMEKIESGEIGYIATGIKDPGLIKIGDTIVRFADTAQYRIEPLPGYQEPKPTVFVSFYPEESDDYELMKSSFEKLRLNDSALTILPDQNEVLGRGFKVGFLGRLHFEITSERLKREFKVLAVNTFPSVVYKVKTKKGFQEIINAEDLPADYDEIWEPVVEVEIILPPKFLPNIYPLQKMFRMSEITTANFQDNVRVVAKMPLGELVSDFDDKLKSMTEGYASFNYKFIGFEKTDVVKVSILVAGSYVPGLSRFLPRSIAQRESRIMLERLKELLPRAQFAQSLQAEAEGRIIAREDIPALKKNVTGYLYGGDRTRKMKLWQKQKRGKKKLLERAKGSVPPEIFKELLKK